MHLTCGDIPWPVSVAIAKIIHSFNLASLDLLRRVNAIGTTTSATVRAIHTYVIPQNVHDV